MVVKNVLQTPSVRTWIEKSMIIKFAVEGKSNYVCDTCFSCIQTWIQFRSTFTNGQKKIEAVEKNGLDVAMSNREQRKLGVAPDTNDEEVDKKPELPVRIKIQPKMEADLFNTYGYTGINSVAPVKVKEEIKEEPLDYESGCVKREPDYEGTMLTAELIQRRITNIKRKFKLIGLREKRKKEMKMRKKENKCRRPSLPTKRPRKSKMAVMVQYEVDDPDDPEMMDMESVDTDLKENKKKPSAKPRGRKKELISSSLEEKKATPAKYKKRKLSGADQGKITPDPKRSKTMRDFFPTNDLQTFSYSQKWIR
ncbi:Hypothetical predicted protein [Cloeon dipterum]|uniref:ZAD domain-containing protein n=1 Tax=Cloeon dipterum TaxID=197152 RepID=A0A8S1C855_9INSE|nr:Hypothetical predicted protein [Cloeon dipterum]